MFKEYPEHRVCVIDAVPIIKKSVKETYSFFLQHNVPASFFSKHKKDLLNVYYHYLFNNFYIETENIKTVYRKVLGIPKKTNNTGVSEFFYANIKPALSVCTLHWCEITSLSNSDTGLIAAIAAEKKFKDHSKLFSFMKHHNLKALSAKIKNKRIFSNLTVDFSRDQK